MRSARKLSAEARLHPLLLIISVIAEEVDGMIHAMSCF